MSSNPAQQQPSALPAPLDVEDPVILSLDHTVEAYIGDFGWKQFLQSTFVSMVMFFDAYQTFITVFADSQPKWSYRNATAALNSTAELCDVPRDLWSWDLPPHSSTVSEWSLQCAVAVVRGLPASAFLMGSIVGGIVLAMLADSSLGRKNLLVLCCLITSVSGALTSLSVNIWMYSALRFVSGFGRGTIGVCSIVLASELSGQRWRGRVGIYGFFCFSLGFLSLPSLAFLLRGYSWRLLYLTTSIPCIIYSLLVYFFVHESPRWLFIQGKKKKFVKTLKSLSSNRKLRENVLDDFHVAWKSNDQVVTVYSLLKVLVKKRWALQRLVIVMFVSVGIGMTYYGMPLGLGNLSYNLYISTTLNAVVEFPASLASLFMIGRMNRKGSVLGLCLLSGVCALASVWTSNKGIQLGLEMVAFFGGCTAFDVLLIYTLELFPTCVRSLAVSVVRLSMVLGGAMSPILVATATNIGKIWFSYLVFGVTIIVSGLFVVWLPETQGGVLSDTMEEEEQKN